MQKGLAAIIATLIGIAVISSFSQQNVPQTPNATCTQILAVECAWDIQRTVKTCVTAVETEGSDIIADIKCVRDLLADKKDCWPCICYESKKHDWKIIGC